MSGRTRLYLWIASVNSLYSVFIITVIVHFHIIVYFMTSTFLLDSPIYLLFVEITPHTILFCVGINSDEPPIRSVIKCSEINQFHTVAEYSFKQIWFEFHGIAPKRRLRFFLLFCEELVYLFVGHHCCVDFSGYFSSVIRVAFLPVNFSQRAMMTSQ